MEIKNISGGFLTLFELAYPDSNAGLPGLNNSTVFDLSTLNTYSSIYGSNELITSIITGDLAVMINAEELTGQDAVNYVKTAGLSEVKEDISLLSLSVPDSQVMNADDLFGDVDNYLPNETGKNFDDCILIYLNTNSRGIDITGLEAPNPVERTIKYLFNDSNSQALKLKNNNSGSIPKNRFLLEKDLNIKDRQGVMIVYNPLELRWNAIVLK